MAETPKDGGLAFPSKTTYRRVLPGGVAAVDAEVVHGGLTARDYFAADALKGLLCEPQWFQGEQQQSRATVVDLVGEEFAREHPPAEVYARAAFVLADAMIAERSA